jgi:hypothetical protein
MCSCISAAASSTSSATFSYGLDHTTNNHTVRVRVTLNSKAPMGHPPCHGQSFSVAQPSLGLALLVSVRLGLSTRNDWHWPLGCHANHSFLYVAAVLGAMLSLYLPCLVHRLQRLFAQPTWVLQAKHPSGLYTLHRVVDLVAEHGG